MKLELKHIAPYLPYDLRFDNGRDYEKDYLIGIRANDYNVKMPQGGDGGYFRLEKIKPILRPLSDLTKKIDHNGEILVPMDILCNEFRQYDCFEFDNVNILNNPYNQIQKLLEWHFDIYGLIENNLAIDINTLEE